MSQAKCGRSSGRDNRVLGCVGEGWSPELAAGDDEGAVGVRLQRRKAIGRPRPDGAVTCVHVARVSDRRLLCGEEIRSESGAARLTSSSSPLSDAHDPFPPSLPSKWLRVRD